jgi:hypothetical protein
MTCSTSSGSNPSSTCFTITDDRGPGLSTTLTRVTSNDDDPWAGRYRPGFRPYLEPPAEDFSVPGIVDPAEAEARWAHYLEASGARPDSRRVYSLTYFHGADKIEVNVGSERREYRRTRGRGRGLDFERRYRLTGTTVSGIVDSGDVIYVWSFGPPFGGWANPSLVGPDSLERIQYFKPRG